MLQQTQVQTVLSRFYAPFLTRFPTLQSLADATEEEVLKAWEGLGYYSRARNLHAAAKQSAPTLPVTVEGLMALSGIGRNTAHAIAAFAYRHAVPVMEANVKRVLHRLTASETLTERTLWEVAQKFLDADNPYDYNQAMMDVGAMICTPTRPKCEECPLALYCEGKSTPLAYPVRKTKKPTAVRERVILVCEAGGRYYLSPRTTRFLGGLYGFPEMEVGESVVWQGNHYALDELRLLGGVEQVYSHFRLSAHVYLLTLPYLIGEATAWFTLTQLKELPLSGADHKVLQLVNQKNNLLSIHKIYTA
jgi:A/G-specific adenine glycosylase